MRFALCALLLFAACGQPIAEPGTDARIVVHSATFYRGAPPATGSGPAITAAAFVRSQVAAGSAAGLSGTVPVGTGSLLVGAKDDVGYWVVSPDVVDPLLPDQLDFAAKVVLSAFVTDPIDIELRAVTVEGAVGPVTTLTLSPEALPVPMGKVVVSLSWDTQADLDLRVVDPNGVEVWSKKINSYTPPPPPNRGQPDDYLNGGILDFDSNAGCVIDGRRQENIVWQKTAPPGVYLIRVDTFSLCSQPAARWHVTAQIDGAQVYESRGESLPSDTRFDHGPGAGLYVGNFTLPE
jgi:hypothetical protein